ncbi:MAG TPA: sulfatase-like hydrolase/transferase, partial [Anaerolineales bacterium]|nr:sulfatase-like hydrolase/transferase [Anaerolineales bacterium]
MTRVNRRDFLKLNAALAAGAALSAASSAHPKEWSQAGKPNILVFVFDAMSARHLSLYGYPRRTTPNLERFAERASVYHRHYAAGNFTTPGTASMLTGMYPWTHRAFNYRGMVARDLVKRNIFHSIGSEYTRLAFTQNLWADILLSQFGEDLDFHVPCDAYSRFAHSALQPDDLPGDRTMAYYALQDFLNLRVEDSNPFPGSLLLASRDLAQAIAEETDSHPADHPRGLPTNHDFSYDHISVFAGLEQLVEDNLRSSSPTLGYFHLWSPHEPYNARKEFVGLFGHVEIPAKPRHPLSGGSYSEDDLYKFRLAYDEFIADVDAEFGKLITRLEQAGVLENSYVVVTSDHGELFERGEYGHASALMYAPVTHIPLMIAAPGQSTRKDYRSVTVNIDLVPTLLQVAGSEVPDWVEGKPLPGFGGTEDSSRSVFPLGAKDNAAFRPIEHATFAMIKDN